MAVILVDCAWCGSDKAVKNGKSSSGIQRYRCCAENCGKTFQLVHRYKACVKGMKERIVDMALNGSGIRDSARVLSIAVGTVTSTIKKSM